MLDADLTILEAFADDPTLSQRQLAKRAGLPLANAHFVLRRLMEKGLVKVRRAAKSRHKWRYLYVLTPRGLEAKARLTYRFLERAAADYQRLRSRVDLALGAALAQRDPPPTAEKPAPACVLGDGPLGEVVRDVLSSRPDTELVATPATATLAVVVDPEAPQDAPGVTYVRLA
jgi:EPS-associated MarR family transcriptional regulator